MTNAAPHDLVGVGIGPANLSLAALADPLDGLHVAFFEQESAFRWHPGLMIDGAFLQVPFLADLVSLVDPTSQLSFLSYLRAHERLYPFYFAEKFHIPRTEYADYCAWVSRRLASLRFDQQVRTIRWSTVDDAFELDVNPVGRVLARNVVIGIGTEPKTPAPLRGVAVHSADYLPERDRLVATNDVTVVGSGQSGAEVFLDLLRARGSGQGTLRWLTRTPAFAPMEYSKLGLEQFTPDYTRFFHGLDEPVRDRLVPAQWQLYKAISAETIAEIYDELYRRTVGGGWPDVVLAPAVEVVGATTGERGIELSLRHVQQGGQTTVTTDAVLCATGYQERDLGDLIGPLGTDLERDEAGRLVVDADYRVGTSRSGSLYVQNAERHTHGVGAPDLGLIAWRAATILNSVCGKTVYPLPERTAFTTFGL
ncbi:lysine N(6)-hydroxylase/L-ornithine N(5)-oxygenase family protein [Actinophytocola oryzae]|uniref:L-lysine N6-monooxygenase MbtG n=1 Tax=Actinophytocola oryzae TaxID=502181 RepID=A0A4R7VYM8_9PSEU|nr:SidA/IucD/PvdA family monooxygenase [Actinophytocola oryzae]TDV55290.1 lysine N6-hydroxylase [Actinophytocola oryzae]